jgi:hypothetical protein
MENSMRFRPQLALITLSLAQVLTAVPVLASDPGHLEGYLPSAAHTPGRFGSFWTTDLWIYQQGASTLHLWFNPSGQENSDVSSVVVELSGPVMTIHDVIGTLFGTEGVGSIHYLADGPLTLTSRTSTTAPDGGSYGQTIRGVPLSSAAVPGTGQAGALRMTIDQTSEFRSNLGLVNVSGVASTVQVEIFSADGDQVPGDSSFTIDLPPYGMTQVNDLLARLEPGQRNGLVVRASVVSNEGAILAYVSEVDNQTNDASYREAFRFGY